MAINIPVRNIMDNKLENKIDAAKENLRDTAEDLKSAAEKLSDKAADAADKAKDKAAEIADKAKEAATEAANKAAIVGEKLTGDVKKSVDRESTKI